MYLQFVYFVIKIVDNILLDLWSSLNQLSFQRNFRGFLGNVYFEYTPMSWFILKFAELSSHSQSTGIYDGVRQVWGLRIEPVVYVENPTRIPTSHWKRGIRPSRGRFRPSRCEFRAQNLQREGRSLPREGRGPLFQWDVGINVGFFTETTGSLRNPKTRRTPSYEDFLLLFIVDTFYHFLKPYFLSIKSFKRYKYNMLGLHIFMIWNW